MKIVNIEKENSKFTKKIFFGKISVTSAFLV